MVRGEGEVRPGAEDQGEEGKVSYIQVIGKVYVIERYKTEGGNGQVTQEQVSKAR